MKTSQRGLLAALSLLLIPLCKPAISLAGVGSVDKFTKGGLEFILAEDHSIPNLSLGLWLNTGGIDDPAGKEGLTQLTMDMLMRGTQKRSREQLNEEIEFFGAALATSAGTTSSSIDGETLSRYTEPFMDLFGDVLLNPKFDEAELVKLKRETMDLLKLSLNNDSVLGRRHFIRLVYGDHPYGRPVDGTVKSLGGISIADIRSRYQQLLRKGHITVYASGDIDRPTLERLVEKFFPGIPDGGAKPTKVGAPKPLTKRQLLLVDKPDRSQIQIFIGHPAIAARDPRYYPLEVANTAFGGMFNARYQEEIRVKRGWSYGASSYLSLNREGGIFMMRTFTAIQNVGSVVRKSLEMLAELSKQGLTDDELQKARSSLINEYPFKLDTADKRVDEQLRIKAYGMPEDYLEAYQKRLAAVDLDSVRQATNDVLNADNVVVVAVCEAKRCRKILEESIDGLAGVTVVPYDSL